ncbi:hypothetical protein QCA50_005119 [Cerrena zonata]|uniref:Glycoside hydrolase 35 catalytic domain-containing protein n=1 Tax=Cerrena zonata TaxID=2478898 RepID=A0AAW0GQ72_9APHY
MFVVHENSISSLDGGGFPGWLTNIPAKARTNQTGYTTAWTPYIKAVAKFIEPHQYPDGPIIVVQSENELPTSTPGDPGRTEYMQELEDTLRLNGVNKVPLTSNDPFHTGAYATGPGAVDLYTFDSYPQGFDCSNPTAWPEVNTTDQTSDHQRFNPDELWAASEFQGGVSDVWGGPGYDACFIMTNEQFANVHYKVLVSGIPREYLTN